MYRGKHNFVTHLGIAIAARQAKAYRLSMSSCDTCVVRNRAICSVLESSELHALSSIGRSIKLSKGQTFVWEGDDSLMVANIIEGVFKLTSSLDDGREQIIGVAFPSDFVGRPFGTKTAYSVTALSDAKLCVFSRRDFDSFARTHPELEHKLLQKTLEELDRARRWMLLLGRKTAPERLASFLLEISEKLGGSSCDAIGKPLHAFELPFGRQQIADILGLTIETVSRQMTQFKKQQLIELPNRTHVRICDAAKLNDLAQAAA